MQHDGNEHKEEHYDYEDDEHSFGNVDFDGNDIINDEEDAASTISMHSPDDPHV
jgi:hypothetical protein